MAWRFPVTSCLELLGLYKDRQKLCGQQFRSRLTYRRFVVCLKSAVGEGTNGVWRVIRKEQVAGININDIKDLAHQMVNGVQT